MYHQTDNSSPEWHWVRSTQLYPTEPNTREGCNHSLRPSSSAVLGCTLIDHWGPIWSTRGRKQEKEGHYFVFHVLSPTPEQRREPKLLRRTLGFQFPSLFCVDLSMTTSTEVSENQSDKFLHKAFSLSPDKSKGFQEWKQTLLTLWMSAWKRKTSRINALGGINVGV